MWLETCGPGPRTLMIRPMLPAANIISSPLIPMMRRLHRLAIPWDGKSGIRNGVAAAMDKVL